MSDDALRAIVQIMPIQAPSAVVQELDDLARNQHRHAPSKKRRLDHVSHLEAASQQAQNECAIGSATHYAEKARVVIQGELDGNENMDRERKAILKSALQYVDITGQRRTSITDISSPLEVSHEDFQHAGPFIAPSPELLYMLLPEPITAEGRSSCVQWPDHISDKTLGKMASTILSDDGHERGQLFYQYCTCIYVKAIFHLYQRSRAHKDPGINAQFLKSKKLYETYAFRALGSLNFLNAPTLPFVQSLISGAFFMQYLGNMNQCWILNSYAARLITALGYHEICNQLGDSSIDEEIHSAKNLADTPGFVDPYPTFLTWTVFLYPLSPFFVLFCNIIGESDMDDYNLMQDIMQSLSQFAASPFISKLLKLLDHLQKLCAPLIQSMQRGHAGQSPYFAPFNDWYLRGLSA
ncbi:hypothetical protein PITC_025180 [Penicillium italicum]|uniref:Transcription factor, fungi n=1 Tax=Penicillium italicum TaxID=40296 RepID=A0A0A2LNW1_PENIT|nr:hypothetical protein PITC_025180 [Penicillium italicum]